MHNVSHVMLEHSSNCDTVKASSLINLPRQAFILIQGWRWIYFHVILGSKCEA